ncbi:50S ribosomal protein L13 [Candidatus Peribacteria bacterium]|nr:50S ribosomal protein L13 [Candidatus Peribacteria bacterium]
MSKTTLRQNVTAADRAWFVIDANGQNLGKVAVLAATHLRGRHRADYTPHVDGGDNVVILNAERVAVSGDKEITKLYRTHSRYIGNMKTQTLQEVRAKTPERILEMAVKGMLPKNKLRPEQLRRLKIVVGSENPHAGQQPTVLTVTY